MLSAHDSDRRRVRHDHCPPPRNDRRETLIREPVAHPWLTRRHAVPLRGSTIMIRLLIAALTILLVSTFPATWLLMLFLGNVGLGLSYWGTLPLGILVSVFLSGASARTIVLDAG